MDTRKAYRALEDTAVLHQISVEDLIREIDMAIAEAVKTDDIAVQMRWAEIPQTGEYPTAVELVAYIADQLG